MKDLTEIIAAVLAEHRIIWVLPSPPRCRCGAEFEPEGLGVGIERRHGVHVAEQAAAAIEPIVRQRIHASLALAADLTMDIP